MCIGGENSIASISKVGSEYSSVRSMRSVGSVCSVRSVVSKSLVNPVEVGSSGEMVGWYLAVSGLTLALLLIFSTVWMMLSIPSSGIAASGGSCLVPRGLLWCVVTEVLSSEVARRVRIL